jgi:hypothetical protein
VVVAVATALILAQLVLRTVWVLRGYWAQDDLSLIGTVAKRPLDADLLFTTYAGHLMPGGWALTWFVTAVAPYDFRLAAAVLVGLQAAVDVVFFLLLRQLFGTRPLVLVPLTVVLTTALSLPAFLWWSAAFFWVPLQLALAAALLFHVRYLADGRRLDAVAAIASVVGGLLFIEKSLLIVGVLYLVTVLYPLRTLRTQQTQQTPSPDSGGLGEPAAAAGDRHWWRRSWRTVREQPMYWGALAALCVGYVVLYLRLTKGIANRHGTWPETLEFTRRAALDVFVPGMAGGPWRWVTLTAVNAWADTPGAAKGVAWALIAGVVVGSMTLGTRAWRAWTLLLVYLGLTLAALAWTRLAAFGPAIGQDPRYLADASLVAGLAIGLALMPLRGLPRVPDTMARRLAERPRPLLAAALAAMLAVTGGSVVSSELYVEQWEKNPADAYLTTLLADLRSRDGTVELTDQQVPAAVITPLVPNRTNRLSKVTRALDRPPSFPRSSQGYLIVDGSGRIRPSQLGGIPSAYPPRHGNCVGWPISGGHAVVPLASPAYRWDWVIGVPYTAADDTAAVIGFGDESVPVRLTAGTSVIYVTAEAQGDEVRVTTADPAARVCVNGAVAGTLTPVA